MTGPGTYGRLRTRREGLWWRAREPRVVARFGDLMDAMRQEYTLGYQPSAAKPLETLCQVHKRLSDGFFTRHPGAEGEGCGGANTDFV